VLTETDTHTSRSELLSD